MAPSIWKCRNDQLLIDLSVVRGMPAKSVRRAIVGESVILTHILEYNVQVRIIDGDSISGYIGCVSHISRPEQGNGPKAEVKVELGELKIGVEVAFDAENIQVIRGN